MELITSKRKIGIIWIIISSILTFIIKKVLDHFYIMKTTHFILNIILDNFGIILALLILFSLLFLLLYWKIRDYITQNRVLIEGITRSCLYANLRVKYNEISVNKMTDKVNLYAVFDEDVKKNFTKNEWDFYTNYDYRNDITFTNPTKQSNEPTRTIK